MLRALTRAESAAWVFAGAIALAYGALPLAVHLWFLENEYFVQLAGIAGVGAACVVLGSRLPILDRLEGLPRWAVREEVFLAATWGAFLAFVLLATVTAERIPFVAALQGVDADTLATLREQFLKAREGWQASFPYVNAVLAGALVPYALVLMLVRRHRLRWVFFAVFLLYCLSFVEKAFFLKAAIPLAYLVFQGQLRSVVRPGVVVAGGLALLGLVTVVSGVTERSESGSQDEFFSTAFTPEGPLGFLVWRSVAIPVVTAGDALRLFEDEYGGRPLLGATSSLVAGLRGVERVNVEREIYAVQWGQNETETGNANSVYLTEAYLNFGMAGVVAFSLLVGAILRLFARSRDEPLRSLWPLFCFTIYVAPLTGTLFSNGFLPVFALSLLVDIVPAEPAPQGGLPAAA